MRCLLEKKKKNQFKVGLKQLIIHWGLIHQISLGAQLLSCPVVSDEFRVLFCAEASYIRRSL